MNPAVFTCDFSGFCESLGCKKMYCSAHEAHLNTHRTALKQGEISDPKSTKGVCSFCENQLRDAQCKSGCCALTCCCSFVLIWCYFAIIFPIFVA